MMDQLLPRQIDNDYRGYKAGLWIFGLVVLLRLVISVNSMVIGRSVATNADGIPLDAYSAAAAQTVLSLFATLGLAHLMLCLICILALVRYRAMVPLLFALLLVQQLARYALLYFFPIERVGAPPGTLVNLALLALMFVGLALSLLRRPMEGGIRNRGR